MDYCNIYQVSSEYFQDQYIRFIINNILAVTAYEIQQPAYLACYCLRWYEYLIQMSFSECLQSSTTMSNVSDENCLSESYKRNSQYHSSNICLIIWFTTGILLSHAAQKQKKISAIKCIMRPSKKDCSLPYHLSNTKCYLF